MEAFCHVIQCEMDGGDNHIRETHNNNNTGNDSGTKNNCDGNDATEDDDAVGGMELMALI